MPLPATNSWGNALAIGTFISLSHSATSGNLCTTSDRGDFCATTPRRHENSGTRNSSAGRSCTNDGTYIAGFQFCDIRVPALRLRLRLGHSSGSTFVAEHLCKAIRSRACYLDSFIALYRAGAVFRIALVHRCRNRGHSCRRGSALHRKPHRSESEKEYSEKIQQIKQSKRGFNRSPQSITREIVCA